jgi:hypothetical protein
VEGQGLAAGVNRQDIEHCAADLGVPLDEHIGVVLAALQAHAAELGLTESRPGFSPRWKILLAYPKLNRELAQLRSWRPTRAKTCLICGTDLTLPIELVAPPPEIKPARASPWRLVVGRRGDRDRVGWRRLFLQSRVPARAAHSDIGADGDRDITAHRDAHAPTAYLTPTVTLCRRNPTHCPADEIQVRSGDTLSTIADRFDTTVERLQAFNGLGDADELQVGQVLQIPTSGSTPNPTNTPRPTETLCRPTPGQSCMSSIRRHAARHFDQDACR